MSDKLKISLKFPRSLFGSEEYTVIVEVTNLCDKALSDISVDSQLLPGNLFVSQESPSYSELDKLVAQKFKLINEMEEQIAGAYERHRMSKYSVIDKVMLTYLKMPEIIASTITRTQSRFFSVPIWAREAFKINEWDDVIRLEEEVISLQKDDSLLKKAFLINKEKLQRVLSKIAETKQSSPERLQLTNSIIIQSGETIAFTFRCRAPHLYRQKSFDCQFKVSYVEPEKQTSGNYSVGDVMTFYASSFSIPLGAGLGSIIGFIVKIVFISPIEWFSKNFWLYLVGSILLSIIVAFCTARSNESKKSFTVEDFTGGFIVGAFSGLFAEKLIDYLKTRMPR